MKRKLRSLCIFCIVLVCACKKEQIIPVKAGFDYTIIDSNYTVPARISFSNTSSGAQSYEWTFQGGAPSVSDKKNPGVIEFDTAGTYIITLKAWNQDRSDTKTITIRIDSAVQIGFDTTVLINHFSPLQVQIQNTTTGGSTFNWTFEGGVPATSTLQQPPVVTFTDTGYHKITLAVGNGSRIFTLTKEVHVDAALNPSFTVVPIFDDDDWQAPLTASLNNTTVSGLTWKWKTTGGTISNDTAFSPSIYFANPGTYTVTLSAGNGKETKDYSQSVTILTNTNLRSFADIKLGINTADKTIGSFFSTKLRKVFRAGDDLDTAGKYIDIVFFGLNKNFDYNKFLSPDSASAYTFAAIPNAMQVKVINSQELCGCGNLSVASFDAMTNDAPLQNININPTASAWHQFDSSIVPRIVLYQAQDGRKGAIKVKQFVSAGDQSYIIVDIKVQKTP